MEAPRREQERRRPCEGPHDWKVTETPIDSAKRWFRCAACGVYGYSRDRFVVSNGAPRHRRRIGVYKCSIEGCSEPAVVRLTGRGPRCSYIWRCDGHRDA